MDDEPEDLNTYVGDICFAGVPTARYKGKRIIPTDAGMRELMTLGMALKDVADILENGQDSPRKRQRGKIERWLQKGKKTYNVVVAEDYDCIMKEPVWALIHLGKFTTKSGRKRDQK